MRGGGAASQLARKLGADLVDLTRDGNDARQVRISCTYGMLLCLPRPQRAAYVLADVLG